jgi:predicted  nucleic acid-binding Zn-ribbon protein
MLPTSSESKQANKKKHEASSKQSSVPSTLNKEVTASYQTLVDFQQTAESLL